METWDEFKNFIKTWDQNNKPISLWVKTTKLIFRHVFASFVLSTSWKTKRFQKRFGKGKSHLHSFAQKSFEMSVRSEQPNTIAN